MGKHLLILTPAVLLDGIGRGLIVEVPLQGSVCGGRLDVGPLRLDLSFLSGEHSSRSDTRPRAVRVLPKLHGARLFLPAE